MHNNGGVQEELQETIDEIAGVLGASATLEDRSFQLIAYGAQSGDIDLVRQESILRRRATDEVRAYFERFGIAAAGGPVRIPADADLAVLARVCVPLRHNDVTYGYLWLLDSGSLTDERLAEIRPLVERAAATLAQDTRGRQDLGRGLRALFSADPDERADALARLDLRGPVAAIAVRDAPGRVVPLWTLPRAVLSRPGSPVALLAPAHQALDVAARARGMYGTAAGVGGARAEASEAWRSWREAVHALRIAEHIPRFAPVARWEDLGVHRTLARLGGPDLRELAAATEVLAADDELARTVECYLDHAGDVKAAAAELGVHRQTLYYRLSKAARLTGLDLGSGDDRLAAHLGLKAARLLTNRP
ncbi:PucR C-terminal helix-turn-helix domain-containing protein [Sinosporangium album]|uniref:PucR C-terminal helix-turn-helix domain-containing protein n=1 Tax=Sinosporangium album TaxID=504805 RepID=A0A1G7QTG4_9ACTN|nr:helix-turn-helix domain-containing protein [Sinosporangium album]SDG01773.1 PucR C-terminal helix-turn-helix domain-containing protein [Sinosporangium album]